MWHQIPCDEEQMKIFCLSQLMAIWLCHPAIQYHLSWDPLGSDWTGDSDILSL